MEKKKEGQSNSSGGQSFAEAKRPDALDIRTTWMDWACIDIALDRNGNWTLKNAVEGRFMDSNKFEVL